MTDIPILGGNPPAAGPMLGQLKRHFPMEIGIGLGNEKGSIVLHADGRLEGSLDLLVRVLANARLAEMAPPVAVDLALAAGGQDLRHRLDRLDQAVQLLMERAIEQGRALDEVVKAIMEAGNGAQAAQPDEQGGHPAAAEPVPAVPADAGE